MKLIDADALLGDITKTIEESGCVNHESEIIDCIEYAPVIDTKPSIMEFDEKTRWAINILISHAVCRCKELYCEDDCPLYEDEKGDCDDVVWTDENIVTAVKWLNGMKGVTIIRSALDKEEPKDCIVHETTNGIFLECPKCGYWQKEKALNFYCPNCGQRIK